jgi:hypothetical protein
LCGEGKVEKDAQSCFSPKTEELFGGHLKSMTDWLLFAFGNENRR